MSKALLERMDKLPSAALSLPLGQMKLRGKEAELDIVALSRRPSFTPADQPFSS
jgi:hypothetical protein